MGKSLYFAVRAAIPFVASTLLVFGARAQTSIVIIRTNTKIVVAADSKVTNENDVPLDEVACKINRTGNFYWAASGLNTDSISGFNISALITQAAKRPAKTLSELAQRSVSAIEAPLFQTVTRLWRSGSPLYERIRPILLSSRYLQ